jgi:hypothetical protein
MMHRGRQYPQILDRMPSAACQPPWFAPVSFRATVWLQDGLLTYMPVLHFTGAHVNYGLGYIAWTALPTPPPIVGIVTFRYWWRSVEFSPGRAKMDCSAGNFLTRGGVEGTVIDGSDPWFPLPGQTLTDHFGPVRDPQVTRVEVFIPDRYY